MDVIQFLGILLLIVLILSFLTPFICGHFLKNSTSDHKGFVEGANNNNYMNNNMFEDDDYYTDSNTGFYNDDYSSSDSFSYDDEYEPVTDITDPQCLDDSEPWDWTF